MYIQFHTTGAVYSGVSCIITNYLSCVLFRSGKEAVILGMLRQLELTKLTGYRLVANKSHGIGSVRKLVYSPIPIPAFTTLSEAFSITGISIGTTLITSSHRVKDMEKSRKVGERAVC